MSKCEKICLNCDDSFYDYSESSMHYGLRCDRYEKCVDEKDSCEKFSPSSHILKKELEGQLSQAKELIKVMLAVLWSDDPKQWHRENADKIKALLGEE